MSGERASAVRTACVFGAGVALGCAAAYAATSASRRARPQAPAALAAAHAPQLQTPIAPLSLDDEIVGEQLTRNVQFFGREGQQRVCDAFVVVVGLGVRGACAARGSAALTRARRRAWAATRRACCCALASDGCAS